MSREFGAWTREGLTINIPILFFHHTPVALYTNMYHYVMTSVYYLSLSIISNDTY